MTLRHWRLITARNHSRRIASTPAFVCHVLPDELSPPIICHSMKKILQIIRRYGKWWLRSCNWQRASRKYYQAADLEEESSPNIQTRQKMPKAAKWTPGSLRKNLPHLARHVPYANNVSRCVRLAHLTPNYWQGPSCFSMSTRRVLF